MDNTTPEKFELKKDFWFFILLILIPAVLGLVSIISLCWNFGAMTSNEKMVAVFAICLVLAVFYFLSYLSYYRSYYELDKGVLICQFGLYKYKIDVDTINYLVKANYPTAGRRPGLSFSGIKLNYDMGYSIYLTPQNEAKFVDELIRQKPKIKYME